MYFGLSSSISKKQEQQCGVVCKQHQANKPVDPAFSPEMASALLLLLVATFCLHAASMHAQIAASFGVQAVSGMVVARAQAQIENFGRKTEEKIRSWLGLTWKDGSTTTEAGPNYFIVYHQASKGVALEPGHKRLHVLVFVAGIHHTLHERSFNIEGRSWDVMYSEVQARVAAYKHMLPKIRGEL